MFLRGPSSRWHQIHVTDGCSSYILALLGHCIQWVSTPLFLLPSLCLNVLAVHVWHYRLQWWRQNKDSSSSALSSCDYRKVQKRKLYNNPTFQEKASRMILISGSEPILISDVLPGFINPKPNCREWSQVMGTEGKPGWKVGRGCMWKNHRYFLSCSQFSTYSSPERLSLMSWPVYLRGNNTNDSNHE